MTGTITTQENGTPPTKMIRLRGKVQGYLYTHSIEIHGYKVTKMKDRGANFN